MSSTTTTTTTTTTPSSTITGTIMQHGNEGGDVDDSGFDMQLFKEIISSILLFMLLFGMSATVDFQALMNQLKNKRAILSGVIMQYVFMPVLGFASVMMLGDRLHPAVGITLLVVTSSPGGSYSNLICNLANADLPLSVAMTALSTILSIVMLPANLLLYSKLAYGINSPKQTDSSIEEDASVLLNSIDWGALFTTLGIVLGAILSGLYASSKLHSKRFRRCCNHVGTICGILLIVVSVAVSSGNVETRLWNKDWAFYVGVSFPALVGLLLANIIAAWIVRLKKPEVVTVAVECCYQNVGIATSVALSMFDDPTLQGNALCVPMYYGLLEALVLTIYAIIAWKMGWTKAPPDENMCVAMGTTYEVSDDDTDNSSDEDCSSNNDISTMQQTLTMSESTIRNGVRSMDSDDDPALGINHRNNDVEMGTTIVGAVELAQDPSTKKKNKLNFFSSSTKKHGGRSTASEQNDNDDNENGGNDGNDDWNYDHEEDTVEMKKKQTTASSTPTMAMMTNRQRTSTSVTDDTTDSQSVNSSTPLTTRDRFATASMTEEDVDAYFTSSTGGSIRVRRINSVESLTQTTPGGALQQQPFPSTPRSAISFDDTSSSEYDSNYPNTISPSSTWPSVTSPLPTPPSSSGGGAPGGGNRGRLYSREPLMPPLHE